MLDNIKINGFKNLSDVDFKLAPLTIITGKNSTGKSSMFQAVLFCQQNAEGAMLYTDFTNIDFDSIRNKYTNSKEANITLTVDNNVISYDFTDDGIKCRNAEYLPIIEKNIFYLSANRTGAENSANIYQSHISGPNGNALFGTFEQEKSKPIDSHLIKEKSSFTLSSQLNFWLSYILDIPLELHSERRAANNIEIKYKSDNLPDILPTQLGAGVSYLAKILILCLRSKKNDIIMIENPEIHLYPAAQSRLAEFLTFIASNDRQLLLESHSDIIVTKIRHEVFKGKIKPEYVLVLFKDSIISPFEPLTLDINGKFNKDFPESFFDATLQELLEID